MNARNSNIQHPTSREAPSSKLQMRPAAVLPLLGERAGVRGNSASGFPNAEVRQTSVRHWDLEFGACCFSGAWSLVFEVSLDVGCSQIVTRHSLPPMIHWFFSKTVRQATAMRKHVQKLLRHQQDILPPQAVEGLRTAIADIQKAIDEKAD